MRRSFITLVAAAAIVGASPALAQNDQTDAGGDMSAGKIDEVAEIMANLFQAEPLTAEQEARLPRFRRLPFPEGDAAAFPG